MTICSTMAMNRKYQQLFFDLDGTLNDSAPGICKSMQYALEKLEQTVPDEESLRWVVGPPIGDNFRRILETEDHELVERGIQFFRERYEVKGKLEAQLYAGVHAMLQSLNAYQGNMRIMTSKLEDFAIQIAHHFELHQYFDAVHGSHAGKQQHTSDSKGARLKLLIETHGYDPSQCLMIGDREYDIIAAKENGLQSIGVSYGYGSIEELTNAGADVIVHSPAEVAEFILNH